MTGTKILWGQMLGALVMVLLGCWAATEWTAWRLGFQPALGSPWVRIGAAPVYPPQLFFGFFYAKVRKTTQATRAVIRAEPFRQAAIRVA